jgi:arsenite methyltransferase
VSTQESMAGSGGSKLDAEQTREKVRAGYGALAQSTPAGTAGSASGCCGGGGCCGPATYSADDLARAVGYSSEELAQIPVEANLGLSCGNPTAIASLAAGEIVLDLGSGGGFDCFLAGAKVGPRGRVIGVDMTAEMVSRARRNVAAYRAQSGLDNVEFRLGEIEYLPVADASVDVVISNCVLNLSPDKPQVWREIARVLRPGGRVAISDLALLRPLPEAVREMVEALVGCIAGAELVEQTRRNIEAAGLEVVSLEQKSHYMAMLDTTGDPLLQKIAAQLPAGLTPADYVTSVNIEATRR